MSKVLQFFITNRTIAIHGGEVRCEHCKAIQKEGDPVASRRGGSGLRKLYCEECAFELVIITKRLEK